MHPLLAEHLRNHPICNDSGAVVVDNHNHSGTTYPFGTKKLKYGPAMRTMGTPDAPTNSQFIRMRLFMSGTSSAGTDAAMQTVFLATVRRAMGSCTRRGLLPTPLADADLVEIEKVLLTRREDAIFALPQANLKSRRSRSFYEQRTEAKTRNNECVCIHSI